MTIDRIYGFNRTDGSLVLYFANSREKLQLKFTGKAFRFTKEKINKRPAWLIDWEEQDEIVAIKLKGDSDFFLSFASGVLLKISSVASTSYSTGVCQQFAIFYPTDSYFSEVNQDFKQGRDIRVLV